jgi:copper chaperone CopZ
MDQEKSVTAQDRITQIVHTHVIREFHVSHEDFAVMIAAEQARRIPDEHRIACMDGVYEPRLKGVPGIENTDYSVESGANFSVLIKAEFDTPETHAAIAKRISQTIDAAHRALSESPS